MGTSRMRGDQREAEYYCRNHKSAKALCPYNNGHAAHNIEAAVLDFLGQYSDPAKVRDLLAFGDAKTDKRQEQELGKMVARLGELEQAFLNDLDRVDRHVLTEAEYLKRQEVRRTEQANLEARKVELQAAVEEQRDRETQVKTVPLKVHSFLEDFQNMEVTRAKAILQTIVKAAHVWKDGKIQLEFR